jgi:hypothetical protein
MQLTSGNPNAGWLELTIGRATLAAGCLSRRGREASFRRPMSDDAGFHGSKQLRNSAALAPHRLFWLRRESTRNRVPPGEPPRAAEPVAPRAGALDRLAGNYGWK